MHQYPQSSALSAKVAPATNLDNVPVRWQCASQDVLRKRCNGQEIAIVVM